MLVYSHSLSTHARPEQMRQEWTLEGDVAIWGFLKLEGMGREGVSGKEEDFAIIRPLQRGWRHCAYVRPGVKKKKEKKGGGGS